MREAVVVAGSRTPLAKSHRGVQYHPAGTDLAAHWIVMSSARCSNSSTPRKWRT